MKVGAGGKSEPLISLEGEKSVGKGREAISEGGGKKFGKFD